MHASGHIGSPIYFLWLSIVPLHSFLIEAIFMPRCPNCFPNMCRVSGRGRLYCLMMTYSSLKLRETIGLFLDNSFYLIVYTGSPVPVAVFLLEHFPYGERERRNDRTDDQA